MGIEERFHKKIQESCGLTSKVETDETQRKKEMSPTTSKLISSPMDILLFDIYHTIPAVALIMLYGFASISIYEILSTAITHFAISWKNQTGFYLCLFFIGISVLRITGRMWVWLYYAEGHFECIRIARKNKRKLVKYRLLRLKEKNNMKEKEHWLMLLLDLEDKKQRWFFHHKSLTDIVCFVAIYLCIISVSHFTHNVILPKTSDNRHSVMKGMPSLQMKNTYHGEVSQTIIQERIVTGEPVVATCATRNMSAVSPENWHYFTEDEMNYCWWEEQKILNEKIDEELDSNETCAIMDTFFNTTEINVCQVSSKNETSWVEKCATIEDWNRLLYNEDDFYLWSKTSVASYYSFMGDASAVIINTRDSLMIHSVISGIAVFCLYKLGIIIWSF